MHYPSWRMTMQALDPFLGCRRAALRINLTKRRVKSQIGSYV
jgi:hypothetical protein